MRKLVSIFVTFAILSSIFCMVPVFAENATLLYTTNFEGENDFGTSCTWRKANGRQTAAWEKNAVGSGTHLYLKDESESDVIHVSLNKDSWIPVEAGKTYTLMADLHCTGGALYAYLRFYSSKSSSTPISSVIIAKGEQRYIETLVQSGTAPAEAKYAEILLGTASSSLGEGDFYHVSVYEGIKSTQKSIELDPPAQEKPIKARIVAPRCGKLEYNPYNEQGDKLSDFSYAGFCKGEYELPNSENLPVAAILSPLEDTAQDATSMIQEAIDAAATNGKTFHVVKLKAGKYTIAGTIQMKSGVILSGEGQGPEGTLLYDTKTGSSYERTVLMQGQSPIYSTKRDAVMDPYVEAGSYEFSIDSTRIDDYQVGDLIQVVHESTDEWCEQMNMKGADLGYGGGGEWGNDHHTRETFFRTITAIDGNKLTVDIPFYVPMETTYAKPYITKVSDDRFLSFAGIENLRMESYYNGDPNDENHSYYGVYLNNAKDCFIRDVSFKYYLYSAVVCKEETRQVTVKNCSSLQPVSKIEGDRRYPFFCDTHSQQILFSGCYSYDGRHDYATSRPCNGIVFSDCVADSSNQASETHGTWSAGVLYDNIMNIGNDTLGYMAFSNRGVFGIGKTQGWSGAGVVAWNCLSPVIIGYKPPMTYQNFIVGQWGYYDDLYSASRREGHILEQASWWRVGDNSPIPEEATKVREGSSFAGNCYMESAVQPVEPRSLYKAQMAERFSSDCRKVRPNAPVLTTPRSDDAYTDGKLTIEGMYQRGAEKVTVYIDNIAYEAALDDTNYMFSLQADLTDGAHKIYATQTIKAVEGNKCADRFITVNGTNGNPDYLQSRYDFERLHPILDDNVIPYDQYQNANSSQLDAITVNVNGINLQSDVEPVETDGRVLVPARALFEALDAEVTYDETTATAYAVRESKTIAVTQDSATAYVNDEEIHLDVPAVIVNDRFLVPLRFAAESFGADVEWNDKTKTVIIEGGTVTYPAIHGLPKEIGVFRAMESGNDGAGHTIGNLFDGTDKEWAVSADHPNGAYGVFDFGSIKAFKNIHIQFMKGTERVYTFDLFVSDDGENFTKIQECLQSSGQSDDMEVFPINASGRYIKIVGYGNSENKWNNYLEMAFTQQ